MNKKGIFGVLLVFATIMIIGTAIISFNVAKNKISSEIDTPIRLIELNAIKNNFLIYSNNSVILASQHSYNGLFKEMNNLFPSSCTTYLNSIIITNECLINQNKLENKFLEKFNSEYSDLITAYPINSIKINTNQIEYYKPFPKFETQINGDLLVLESNGQEFDVSKQTKFMDYTYTINLNPKTTLNLTKEKIFLNELKGLIAEINLKSKACKLKTTDQEILSCFNEINQPHFTLSPSIGTNHILMEIKTKDKFFFDELGVEKFDNLSFNVAISKA